ncbi:MAG: histone deacetylase [Thermodesulfobacteriota bacterium]|nr:histone deacetylase [Thermodesulfobacteriota bacterium]
MKKVGIIKDERYFNHITSDFHPESPGRLKAVYDVIDSSEVKDKLMLIPPRMAVEEELTLNHSTAYIKTIAATAGKNYTMLDPDTSASPLSWETACLAVGGLLNLVDKIMVDEIDRGFAIIRPPGHHAENSRSMGFCLFNNVAIAAMYGIKKYSWKKVLIVDWDLHHGNGTQNSFYDKDQVLYFSTHQYPYYPGSGGYNEVGEGKGAGFTVNIPLAGEQGDHDFLSIFQEILYPIGKEYSPDIVLVSVGFDTYFEDPLGSMNVTPEGYALLTDVLLQLARECCGGKVILVLEGGYHLKGLAASVLSVLKKLLSSDGDLKELMPADLMPSTITVLNQVKKVLGKFWHNI